MRYEPASTLNQKLNFYLHFCKTFLGGPRKQVLITCAGINLPPERLPFLLQKYKLIIKFVRFILEI